MELNLAKVLSAEEREALHRLPDCQEGRALLKAAAAFKDKEWARIMANGKTSDVIREDVRCQVRAMQVCEWVGGLPEAAKQLEEEKETSK